MTCAIRLLGLLLCLSISPALKAETAPTKNPATNALHTLLVEVLEVWGLSARFQAGPSEQLEDMRALTDRNPALLVYNRDWVMSIRPEAQEEPNWIRYAQAAHQIAHLQMGHTERTAQTEAEADWYTGFVLGVKGADMGDAIAFRAPKANSNEIQRHNAQQRMEIIAAGWRRGRQQQKLSEAGIAPYLLPDSGHELLKEQDLKPLSAKQLRLARNEIFARHGYRFKDPELARYFGKQLWYLPRDRELQLNAQEKANVAFLKKHEQNSNAPAPAPSKTHSASAASGPAQYLYPESNRRLLTRDELYGLSPAALRLIRNEIFARHGYRFKSADLNRYFNKQPWYQAKEAPLELSKIESANVALIRTLE